MLCLLHEERMSDGCIAWVYMQYFIDDLTYCMMMTIDAYHLLYEPGADAGYTQAHNDQSDAMFCRFLGTMHTLPQQVEDVLVAAQLAALALNDVNAACGERMIETDQRENLITPFHNAMSEVGLEPARNITLPWRSW